MGKTLPEKLITRISGVVFILFGVAHPLFDVGRAFTRGTGGGRGH
jgi:putative Ca2+/H+ antiporter (TMEM165/GDT1 family)